MRPNSNVKLTFASLNCSRSTQTTSVSLDNRLAAPPVNPLMPGCWQELSSAVNRASDRAALAKNVMQEQLP